jgi:hypothetical protein
VADHLHLPPGRVVALGAIVGSAHARFVDELADLHGRLAESRFHDLADMEWMRARCRHLAAMIRDCEEILSDLREIGEERDPQPVREGP